MTAIRKAPDGFTPAEWEEFNERGFIHVPNRVDPDDVTRYLAAAERLTAGLAPSTKNTNKVQNVVARDPELEELIDHDRHIGYAYDIFGDQVRLSQNDIIVRQPGSVVNQWHVDGPRAVPFRTFSPVLPLKLRIGYWLTDVTGDSMGNLVVLPGSHRGDYPGEHAGTGELPGQEILQCRAGTMTVFHASLWHRVQPNTSNSTRVNFFLSYTPSWINGYAFQDPGWAGGLTRERRIIARAHGDDQEQFIRPAAEDLPLFDDPDSIVAGEQTESHKLRRLTRYERYLSGSA